jgi:hypothetical protein
MPRKLLRFGNPETMIFTPVRMPLDENPLSLIAAAHQ